MSQRDTVLRMLREAGPTGVSAHVFNYEMGITRSAAVVHELRQDGHSIDTVDEGKLPDGRNRMARYVLRGALGVVVQPATVKSEPLVFPCGCIRAADGQGWDGKCYQHRSR